MSQEADRGGQTWSLWMNAAAPATVHRPPMRDHTSCDVCVIGAGLAGISTALELARRGLRVVVLEARTIGGGETGRTTAHLVNAWDDRYHDLEDRLGLDAARIVAQSHTAAIDHLERTSAEEGIACDLRRVDGYLFLPPGEREEVLFSELAAAQRAGVPGVEMVERAPGFDSGLVLHFPRQGEFHPLKYLLGAAAALEARRGVIHTGTSASTIEKDGNALQVRTDLGLAVSALSVVVATNSPVNTLVAMHTKQEAYRTYALAAQVPLGSLDPGLWWDTSELAGEEDGPYHYVRTSRDGMGEYLVIGGSDHPTGDTPPPDAWDRLEAWARERWPMLGSVVHRWSGQVMEPADGVAYIGASPSGPEGVFLVTGDSGMGMTHAAIAAMMLPSLIMGEKHAWADLYDPSRKAWHGLGTFFREGAKTVAGLARWLGPGERVESLAPGEGVIVRHGLHLLAVHRDDQGTLQARSAKCTHLGCVVRWNGVEKTWDCPCHGSRFGRGGEVLNGPATTGLKPERL